MGKHTPEPWEVRENYGDFSVGFYRQNAEAGGFQFCSIANVMERIGCTEGNAHLIASAPAMYAELRRIYDRLAMQRMASVSMMTEIERDDFVRIGKVLGIAVEEKQ